MKKPCIRIGGGIGICSCSLITDNMVEAQVIIFREEISKLLQAFADGKVREAVEKCVDIAFAYARDCGCATRIVMDIRSAFAPVGGE